MFKKLYYLIDEKKELYEYFRKKGEEFFANRGIDFSAKPEMTVQLNRICHNNCSFCSTPANGKYLNVELLIEKFENTGKLSLSGGEALLHPKGFDKLLEKYTKKSINQGSIMIMTSGCNPCVDKKIIKTYYNNLETFFESSQNLNYSGVCFSYSDNAQLRLKEFMNIFNELRSSYPKNKINLMFRLLIDDISEIEKGKENIRKLSNNYASDIEVCQIYYLSGKNMTNFNSECLINNNELYIDCNGNIIPCCGIVAQLINLPYIAHISENFEDILNKRLIYYGIFNYLREESNNTSCFYCVNAMPEYLKSLTACLNKKFINCII